MLKEGDIVTFNYNKHARTNAVTLSLMEKFIKSNEKYTVKYIHHYVNLEPHVIFFEKEDKGYWYPMSCFKVVDVDNNYIEHKTSEVIIIDLSK